jgi:hypothetical protein
MKKDRNKEKDIQQETSSKSPQQGEQEPVHFERVTETYGNEETLEDEAAAEQQRKETLTERD